jgi:ABC-type transporter MlaC component
MQYRLTHALITFVFLMGTCTANAAAIVEKTPEMLVQESLQKLRLFNRATPGATRQQSGQFLQQHIVPLFDFNFIARWSAGNYYQQLDGRQRTALARHLQQQLIDTMAGPVAENGNVRIDVLSMRRMKHRTTVPVQIHLVPGLPLEVLLNFRDSPIGWRIYDVVSVGASSLTHYRNYVRGKFAKHGSDWLGV